MPISYIQENYLKNIYLLSEGNPHNVTTNMLSTRLQTRPASVSSMLKKLQYQQYIYYEKYYGVRMTHKGKKAAKEVIRRHRLWEVFLHQKLHFDWKEVHTLAEELEHIDSKQLIDRLESYLSHPVSDPHGAPIPNNKYNMPKKSLSSAPPKAKVRLLGVKKRSFSLLEYLHKNAMQFNEHIEIITKEPYDGSMLVRTQKGQEVFLAKETADNLIIAST